MGGKKEVWLNIEKKEPAAEAGKTESINSLSLFSLSLFSLSLSLSPKKFVNIYCLIAFCLKVIADSLSLSLSLSLPLPRERGFETLNILTFFYLKKKQDSMWFVMPTLTFFG